jgi:hypothetical protein
MNLLARWPYKWFGAWREYGPAYQRCPSVQEFVNPSVNANYDKARLRHYLSESTIVASTSRINFPCPFTGRRTTGPLSFRTDGHWLWLDDLPDYIDNHNVAIPDAFLRDIESNGYVPPQFDSNAMEHLEWPPVSA